jgi:hypothetical protein
MSTANSLQLPLDQELHLRLAILYQQGGRFAEAENVSRRILVCARRFARNLEAAFRDMWVACNKD